MVNYKLKYLKYKMKYFNLKYKGGMQRNYSTLGISIDPSAEVSAEVSDDDTVDRTQIQPPPLNFEYFEHTQIDESLAPITQTTDILNSDPFMYHLSNINYFVLVMHGLIGAENNLLNKNTHDIKKYSFNHKLLNTNDEKNLTIINKHLEQYPDSIFLQYATTSGNTCTFSDKDTTMRFLTSIKEIYTQEIHQSNNIFEFFQKFPIFPGFILQALRNYNPKNLEQNILIHREHQDIGFKQHHNLYKINSWLDHPTNVETFLDGETKKPWSYYAFYLNQIIAFIISNSEPEELSKPIVITLAVCRGESVANATNPNDRFTATMPSPRNHTDTEEGEYVPP